MLYTDLISIDMFQVDKSVLSSVSWTQMELESNTCQAAYITNYNAKIF